MAEKVIERWITVNGKHVPIYKDDPESQRTLQIVHQKKKTDTLTAQKRAESLLTEAQQFKYTHDDLKKLWSRAQMFPIYNNSGALIDKIDKVLKKLDSGNPLYKKLQSERARLVNQHNVLLEGHRDRIVKEVEGSRVYMNDDWYHKQGF